MKLQLTPEEQSFLSICVDRESCRVAKLPAAEQKATEHKAIFTLKKKLSGIVKVVSRVEARILQRITENWIFTTRTQIQPEYDRRLAAFPEAAERYAPYIKKLDEDLEVVVVLAEKIKELL